MSPRSGARSRAAAGSWSTCRPRSARGTEDLALADLDRQVLQGAHRRRRMHPRRMDRRAAVPIPLREPGRDDRSHARRLLPAADRCAPEARVAGPREAPGSGQRVTTNSSTATGRPLPTTVIVRVWVPTRFYDLLEDRLPRPEPAPPQIDRSDGHAVDRDLRCATRRPDRADPRHGPGVERVRHRRASRLRVEDRRLE